MSPRAWATQGTAQPPWPRSGRRRRSAESWPSAIRRLTPRRWHRACTGSPSAWPRPVTGARHWRPRGRRSTSTGAWPADTRRTSARGSPTHWEPTRQSSSGLAGRPTPPASARRARQSRGRWPWRPPSDASEGRCRPGGCGRRCGTRSRADRELRSAPRTYFSPTRLRPAPSDLEDIAVLAGEVRSRLEPARYDDPHVPIPSRSQQAPRTSEPTSLAKPTNTLVSP